MSRIFFINNFLVLNHVCIDEDYMVRSLFNTQELDSVPTELSPFLTRCFIARVRCLLDNKSGFLVSHYSECVHSIILISGIVTWYWQRSYLYGAIITQ